MFPYLKKGFKRKLSLSSTSDSSSTSTNVLPPLTSSTSSSSCPLSFNPFTTTQQQASTSTTSPPKRQSTTTLISTKTRINLPTKNTPTKHDSSESFSVHKHNVFTRISPRPKLRSQYKKLIHENKAEKWKQEQLMKENKTKNEEDPKDNIELNVDKVKMILEPTTIAKIQQQQRQTKYGINTIHHKVMVEKFKRRSFQQSINNVTQLCYFAEFLSPWRLLERFIIHDSNLNKNANNIVIQIDDNYISFNIVKKMSLRRMKLAINYELDTSEKV